MDGYAVRADDLEQSQTWSFSLIGESLAGHPFNGELKPGQCVRVFTGAKVPAGADQVLLQEDVSVRTDDRVDFNQHTPAERYVRPVGHDIRKGTELARHRHRVNAFDLGALAAAGIDQVTVFKRPVIGVFSSGDELVDPGTPPATLAEGQIYDSNRFTVLQLLHGMPCELLDLGRLPDDADAVAEAFKSAASRCHALVTSGGVSVGDADFITATIEKLGQLEFWRLNLKPGKPMAFGRIGECYIFGLPGNPVSTIVTLLMVAKPAIWHLAGTRDKAPLRVSAELKSPLSHNPGRAEYQRGIFTQTQDGLAVTVTGDQSSNRLSTFHDANCLIEIHKDATDLPVGSLVNVLPFEGLLN